MNRQINVRIEDVTGQSWELEGSRALLEFLHDEASYWKEQCESINLEESQLHIYLRQHTHIEHSISVINEWIESGEWDDSRLQNEINQNLQYLSHSWLYSDKSLSRVLVDCNKEYGITTTNSFIDYVLDKRILSTGDKESFRGIMIGYEFENQDSDILKRREAEEGSIDYLRSRLEKTKSNLINEVEEFKRDFNTWNKETQQKWGNLLNDSTEQFSNQQKEQKAQFILNMEDCKAKMEQLEKLMEKYSD